MTLAIYSPGRAQQLRALLLLPSGMLSLRAIEARGRAARWGSVVTGILLIVVGLFLTSLVVGILPSIVGVLIPLLALLPDLGDQGPRHESPRQ